MARRSARTDRGAATQAEPGRIARLREFLSESKVEIKKVTWPTRKETITTSVAVVVLVIVVSLYLRVVDMGLEALVKWMLF